MPPLRIRGAGRWYFYVPGECKQFSINMKAVRDRRHRTVAEVFNPDDQRVQRLCLKPATTGTITINPQVEHCGQVWAIALSHAVISGVEGIEPWFAARPEGAKPEAGK